ncbi:MAG TPA: hypothetical protein VM012_14600 [Flavitalea sp.]|nr:hypothetical protein [Flavitalea sp.]
MEIKKRKEEPLNILLRKNKGTVFLTIKIGNAQIGGSIVQFTDEDEPFEKGKIKKLPLGKFNTLNNRTINVITNVLDSNSATNKIIVRHQFHYEEEEVEVITIEDEVLNHNDILSITTTYQFKQQA